MARAHVAVLAACVWPHAFTHAQSPVEVSKDGRHAVMLLPSATDDAGWSSRGGHVPYSLTPDWSLSLRRQVGAVRIVDMNNDGLLDLVVGCFTGSSFPPYTDWEDMIFLNTGTTLEATPSWVSADEVHTTDTQVGDINLDGYPDIFAVSGGTAFANPRIYFGSPTLPSTSAGWFAAPPTPGWATSATLFDVDDDGDLDVITTNQGVAPSANRPMYMFFNDGGNLSTTPGWISAESSIQNTTAAADYDGDGDLDIAVAKWANFESAIYRNTGTTLETTPVWTNGTTNTDRGVAWADVDGNGWPDLAIGEGPTTIRTNVAGDLTLAYVVTPPFNSIQEMAFEDVDLDGDMDFAEVHFGDGRAHVYLNEGGTLASTPSWTFDASTVANALDFGDINGDGWPDLAVGYSGDISVRVFFAVPPPCVADYNGEGDAGDVLDLLDFLDDFGACESQPAPCGTHGNPDFNGDTVIDILDFLDFVDAFGVGC